MPATQANSGSEQDKWLWPFELIEQIGEGGMGIVYRAKYVVNGREVALKMLPKDVTDETILARFERELDVLKNLKHPNIVRCFGGSCENNRRFYAMELVHGGTLEDKLEQRTKLPWEQVIFYGLQMCDALDCSHSQGVIHRDLKPANFLLTESGQLKLSDFGLASVAAARKITAAGKTAGTFLYMAPEQIHGHKVSPQTDLYALGCVLYELVTGEPPFIGDTAAATLHMHCRDTPRRPTERALDCPIALERIILQLLEKKEEDRPESAAEVGKLLRAVKQTVTVVSKDRVTELERTVPAIAASTTDRILAPDAGDGPTSIYEAPAILGVVFLFLFLALLIWNIFSNPSGEDQVVAEYLWLQAAAATSPEQVRLQAIKALGEIASENGRHLEVLRAGLRDGSGDIREASVVAIENAGANAKGLIPALIAVTKDDSEASVRDAARSAVTKLQKAEPQTQFPWLTVTTGILLISALGVSLYLRKRLPNLKLRLTRS